MAADLFLRIGADVKGFADGMSEVSSIIDKNVGEVEKKLGGLDKIGSALQGIGAGLTAAITVPLAGIGAAAVSSASDFESAMNRVSALGEITGGNLKQLQSVALQLGKDTKYSATEAAQGMGELAAAGFKANEIMAAMPAVLNLAATENLEIARASEIAANVMAGFHIPANEVGKAVDVIAKAASSGSVSINDLGATFKYVGPVAQTAGLSFNEMAAAATLLSNAGIKGEQAGTSLRGAIASLIDPSKSAATALKNLGIETKNADGSMRPLNDIFVQLREKGATTADMFKIFGRETASAASVLKDVAGPQLTAMVTQLNNSEGAAKKMADTMNSGLKGAFEQLKGSLETAGISLGQVLLPIVQRGVELFRGFVDNALIPAINWFKELPTPVQNTAVAMAAMAAAIGPLVLAAGTLLGSVSSIAGGITALTSAFSLSVPATTGLAGAAGEAATKTGLLSGALGILTTGLIAAAGAIAVFEIAGIVEDFQALTDVLGITGQKSEETAKNIKKTGDAAKDATPYVDGLAQAWQEYKRHLPSVDILTGPLGMIRQALRDTAEAVEFATGKYKEMDKLVPSSLDRIRSANISAAKAAGDYGLQLAQKQAEERKAAEAAAAHAKAVELAEKQKRAAERAARDLEAALRALGASSEGSTTKMAGLHDKLQLIDQAYRDGKISAEQFVTAFNSYNAALEKANPETKKFEEALKAAGVQKAAAATSLATLNQHLAVAEQALKAGGENAHAAAAAVEALKQKIEAANNPLGAMSAEFDKLAQNMAKVHPTLQELTSTSQTTIKVLDELTGKTIEASAAQAQSQEGALKAEAAFKKLGITLEKDVRKGVDEAKQAFEDIKNSGVATPEQISLAWDAYYVKEIEARRKFGQDVAREEEAFAAGAQKRLDALHKGSVDSWDVMSKQVSTIMTDLSKDIGDKFTSMLLSGKFTIDGIVDMFGAAGKAIVRVFVEQAFSDIMKGLKDLDFSFANFGKSIINVFSSIGKTISNIFGGAGSAASKAAGDLGGIAQGAGGGVPIGTPMNIFGAVTGAVDAITGVLGYLQGRRMEQDIGRIEVTSREIKAETENRRKDAWDQFGKMYDRLGELWNSMMEKFDLLIQAVREGGGVAQAIEESVGHPIKELTEAVRSQGDGQREATGRGSRAIVESVGQVVKETEKVEANTGEIKNVTRSTERVAGAVEASAETVSDAVTESGQATSGTITDVLSKISAETKSVINSPEYAAALRQAQIETLGEVRQFNKVYSKEALFRYREMVEGINKQFGIYEEIGGATRELLVKVEGGINEIKMPSRRTADATEQTAKNVITAAGVVAGSIGEGTGRLGIWAEGTVRGIGIQSTMMATSMIPLAERTANATEATTAAIFSNTEKLQQAISASAAFLAEQWNNTAQLMGQIVKTTVAAPFPTSSGTPSTPIYTPGGTTGPIGGAFPTQQGGAGTPTPRVAGTTGPIITTQEPMRVVTFEDTRRLLEGSVRFAEYMTAQPFNQSRPNIGEINVNVTTGSSDPQTIARIVRHELEEAFA